VSQQELNLFQFTTCLMAKTGTGPPEVVWRERWNLTALSFLLYDTPNDLRTEAGSPILPALLIDRSKTPAVIPEAPVQASIPAFTQAGTGMVRIGKTTVADAWGHFQLHELRDPDVDRSPTTVKSYLDYFKVQTRSGITRMFP
jgi:hypothetical protein